MPARAAFDMKCAQDKLTLTPLDGACGVAHYQGQTCTMGVTGCGRQSTYVYFHDNGTWVLNNVTTTAAETH